MPGSKPSEFIVEPILFFRGIFVTSTCRLHMIGSGIRGKDIPESGLHESEAEIDVITGDTELFRVKSAD